MKKYVIFHGRIFNSAISKCLFARPNFASIQHFALSRFRCWFQNIYFVGVTCVRARAPSRKFYRRNFCSRYYKPACTKVLANQLLKDFCDATWNRTHFILNSILRIRTIGRKDWFLMRTCTLGTLIKMNATNIEFLFSIRNNLVNNLQILEK